MSTVELRSVLAPDPNARAGLLPAIAASFTAHTALAIGAIVGGALWGWMFPAAPLIDPDQAMEVSIVVLPKSKSAMPEKAMRAPRPAGAPVPASSAPTVAPPPVKQSDLTYKVEKPEPVASRPDPKAPPVPVVQPKGDPNADKRRAEVMAQLERERLMADLNAADGPYDQDASDPNGTGDVGMNTGLQGDPGDPEYARYILQLQQLFMQHFRPLPGIAQANPGIRAEVFIQVEPESGKVIDWRFKKPSNNAAYDRAAELAVQEVPVIPKPPPKYAHLAKSGYVIQFDPPRR